MEEFSGRLCWAKKWLVDTEEGKQLLLRASNAASAAASHHRNTSPPPVVYCDIQRLKMRIVKEVSIVAATAVALVCPNIEELEIYYNDYLAHLHINAAAFAINYGSLAGTATRSNLSLTTIATLVPLP